MGDGQQHAPSSPTPQSGRTERFSKEHHPNTIISMQEKLKWWDEEVKSGRRCMNCWLRSYDCFCTHLASRGEDYVQAFESDRKIVKVIMYYHYQELGRSANTAHVFESIFPKNRMERILFGDTKREAVFINELCQEAETGAMQTCILYPCSSSQLLSEWIDQRPPHAINNPVRIVALDGTYSQAARQWKHLTKCMQLKGHRLPVVKLDLEAGKCISAYAGIQHQPNKEKICTYQALVMAMRQAGANPLGCDKLAADLHVWIDYLLKSRVKIGKTQLKKVEGIEDFKPADYVQAYLANHPQGKGGERREGGKRSGEGVKGGKEVTDVVRTILHIEKTLKFTVLSTSKYHWK